MWHQKYRLLLVVYGIGLFVGVREYLVSREKEELTWLSSEGAELTEMLARVNPDDADTEFLRSMQVLAAGDQEEFSRMLERALSANVKHNELLLKAHVDHLLGVGADWRDLNRALNRWRENYPFSPTPISLPLPAPPRTVEEVERLERALSSVSWIADSRIRPPPEGTDRGWQVDLMFRRGRTIDVRDAFTTMTLVLGGA